MNGEINVHIKKFDRAAIRGYFSAMDSARH